MNNQNNYNLINNYQTNKQNNNLFMNNINKIEQNEINEDFIKKQIEYYFYNSKIDTKNHLYIPAVIESAKNQLKKVLI